VTGLQSDVVQRHVVHVPVVGPVEVPVRQLLESTQKPQPLRPVQASHVVDEAHGSVVVRDVHVPASHDRPAQQSATVVQLCELVRHEQRPPVHSIEPQQSALPVHVPAASAQQMLVVGLARQLRPVQHIDTPVHGVVVVPHIVPAGRMHAPLRHSSPVLQGVPVVQHARPSVPHVGATHALAAHAPAHTVPHAPQLRESVVRSTHVPLQQVVPVAVHAVPVVQHVPPSAPHVVIDVWHVPASHTSPALHAVPPQQGSRAPPHAGAVTHEPPVHTSPDAHAMPMQHASPEWPQPAAGAQRPPPHTRPASHESALQQGCPLPPQAPTGTQAAASHTSPVVHAPPEQHGWPERPHDAAPAHVPPEHASPAVHVVPSQQGSRSAPHGGRAAASVAGRPASTPPPPASLPGVVPPTSPLAQPLARTSSEARIEPTCRK